MAEASGLEAPAWWAASPSLGHTLMKGREEERPRGSQTGRPPLARKDSGLNTLPGVGSVQVEGRGPSWLPGWASPRPRRSLRCRTCLYVLARWHALNCFLAALLADEAFFLKDEEEEEKRTPSEGLTGADPGGGGGRY